MFRDTPVYKQAAENSIEFGLRQRVIGTDPSDRVYTVPVGHENRLDLISNVFYGTPSLWWVIAEVNNIGDPLAFVPKGTRLRIPNKDRISNLQIDQK